MSYHSVSPSILYALSSASHLYSFPALDAAGCSWSLVVPRTLCHSIPATGKLFFKVKINKAMSKAEHFWNSHFPSKSVLTVSEEPRSEVTKKIENQILPDSTCSLFHFLLPAAFSCSSTSQTGRSLISKDLHRKLEYTCQAPWSDVKFCLWNYDFGRPSIHQVFAVLVNGHLLAAAHNFLPPVTHPVVFLEMTSYKWKVYSFFSYNIQNTDMDMKNPESIRKEEASFRT